MVELWYRFNFLGEKQFFERRDLIDGLVISAHLVAYYNLSIPQFLSKVNLPILIDPMTFLWGLNPRFVLKGGELRKSYSKLVEKLDCRVANILGEKMIQGIETDSDQFGEFVLNVLKFQSVDKEVKETPRRRSMERIKHHREETQTDRSTQIQHYALIPPYFYFTNVEGNPYEKTVQAAKIAEDTKYGEKYKICPCLCMDKSMLHDEAQQHKVVEDFKDYSEVILWISNLDETEASMEELKGLISLVSKFKESKTDVINFYGGYFSLALNNIGLSKLSSGICFSRRKDVFAEVGGGGLPIRYYEPHLKIKMLADDMFHLYRHAPELFVCNCPICSELSAKYRSAQTAREREEQLGDFFGELGEGGRMKREGRINWENSRLHFLHVRRMEQDFVNKNPSSQIVSDLEEKYNTVCSSNIKRDPHPYRFGSYEYLKLWVDSLQGTP